MGVYVTIKLEMIKIFEKFKDHMLNHSDRVILTDNPALEGLSYKKLNELSGKVLTYLKKKGIGEEDFVAICLPRTVNLMAAMFGILRAGAAFVFLEEHYAAERASFIKKDCNVKVTIDFDVWQEILEEEITDEIVVVGEHAAAFAVYTSGSTGNPKGVVHEYGNIDRILTPAVLEGGSQYSEDSVGIMVAPVTFAVAVTTFLAVITYGNYIHIIPYSVVRNIEELEKYLYDNNITNVGMMPTHFRMIKKLSPSLKDIFVGGEPVRGFYDEKVRILNMYTMSECGFIIFGFTIDKLYDITPVGKSPFPDEVFLLDENGKPVPDGVTGEICCYNPFVRGYLNLPEETAKVFKEGHIFHTGDLACRQPDGNYVILGRCNDMIKINGNRIEPGEIEAAIKKVLPISWVAVKGFIEGDNGYICAYYTDDIKIDYEEIRQKLQNILPYYMIPTYYIKLDSIPMNANGKLDKKALVPPVKNEYFVDYVMPTNETEEKLCKAFANILNIERVGINDDFYLLGGDSLKSIDMLKVCDIVGLSVDEIFKGRTPKKIAQLCLEMPTNLGTIEDDEKALKRSYKLLPEQVAMVDYQLYTPKSTMYNLFTLLRLGNDVDIEKFANAVTEAVRRHPSLLSIFEFDEYGEMIQKYCPEIEGILVEYISEDELESLKDELVQPFKIVGTYLHRFRVFKTECAAYFFMDVHHAVFDGTSFGILFGDIEIIYSGNDKKLLRDTYYSVLAKREREILTPAFSDNKAYFEERYGDIGFVSLPKADVDTRENYKKEKEQLINIAMEQLTEVSDKYHIGYNALFITVTAIMLSKYNNHPASEFNWVYNGRNSKELMSTLGLLFTIFPLAVQLPMDRKINDVIADVNEQIASSLQHGDYHYSAVKSSPVLGDKVCVLYQGELNFSSNWCGAPTEYIPLKHNNAASQNILDIEIRRVDDKLSLLFDFNSARYTDGTMDKLFNLFMDITRIMVSHIDNLDLTVEDVMNEIR